jgi:PAS domain S-box-containing protein
MADDKTTTVNNAPAGNGGAHPAPYGAYGPQDESRVFKAGIVGAGPGCIAILEMLQSRVLADFWMDILAVCDISPDAPGMILARQMGIATYTDWQKMLADQPVDMLLELTGNNTVRAQLQQQKPDSVELIDHISARLLWDVYATAKERIRAETEAQQRIDAERNKIKQIFDSLPDEILVISPDMTVLDVNHPYLQNNRLEYDKVRGRYCYEIDNKLRGECQITEDYCLMREVLRTRQPQNAVYHHIDETGKDIYASTKMTPLTDHHGNLIGVIEATRDITYRIHLEDELAESLIQLETFFQSAPFPISIKNMNGQYIQINDKGCEALGLEFKKIITHTDLEILPRDTAETFRAYDREVFKQKKKEVISEEKIVRGGKDFYYHAIRFPIINNRGEITGVCCILDDITNVKSMQRELERKQNELQATKEYLQNVLENSRDIIITTDLSGNIATFNQGAEEILGYDRNLVIGRPADLLYADPKEYPRLLKRLYTEGGVTNHETQFLRKDGVKVDVATTISHLYDNEGYVIGTVDICRDVTTRKVLQLQLIHQDRLAAIGKLGAGLAHEINNPLAVINEAAGWAEELIESDERVKASPNYEEISESLKKIHQHTMRCKGITMRLLGFASQNESAGEQCNVNNVINDVLDFMYSRVRFSNTRFHTRLSPDVPELAANAVQLQQVLVNLIDNAIDVLPAGGHITISTEVENGALRITVADTGSGIPQKMLGTIFDPFVTSKPVGKGTGLGLSICYGIVNQLGGAIDVARTGPEGTQFLITLPIKPNLP